MKGCEKMAKLHFTNGYEGTYQVHDQTLHIASGKILPYDMTYGAIGACLYSNFLDVAEEKGLQIQEAQVLVDGKKRDQVPAILEYLHVCVKVVCDQDQTFVDAVMEEAVAHCSMVQTFKPHAKIEYEAKKVTTLE